MHCRLCSFGCLNLAAILALSWLVLESSPVAAAQSPELFPPLADEYGRQITQLLKTYCVDCHSTEAQEGDLDLERFADLNAVRNDPRAWQKVAEMLDNGEMPPKDAEQPTADQRKQLREWVRRYLDAEARANAGDPGRVVLRRLSNAEYDHTIRDLTGVDLQPARDFPVDGAAGEGFTNTGESLVMSPALLNKYFDAAKQVASHLVLLEDGFRFAPGESRRDWSNELVNQIRGIYDRHVDAEGRVPLESYLTALVENREALRSGSAQLALLAAGRKLNPRYLEMLWNTLERPAENSIILDSLRERWQSATPADVAALAADIRAWHQVLFKFNNVGHFKSSTEATDPLPDAVTLKRLVESGAQGEAKLALTAIAAAPGSEQAAIIWRRPRFEAAGRPPILLRDVRPLAQALPDLVSRTLADTAKYLAAAARIHRDQQGAELEKVAAAASIDVEILRQWLAYVGVQDAAPATIGDYLAAKDHRVGGNGYVNGWSAPGLPSIVANSSDQELMIPGAVPAKGVAVHPTPQRFVSVAWKSPIAGQIRIEAIVGDAHAACGNGVRYSLELHRRGTLEQVAEGTIDNGATATIPPVERTAIGVDDRVVVLVAARDKDHACDLTRVELQLSEIPASDSTQAPRTWSLSADVVADIHSGNPHEDRLGNQAVWHFQHGLDDGKRSDSPQVPAESALAVWKNALIEGGDDTRLAALAQKVEQLVTGKRPEDGASPDAKLFDALHSPSGPLLARLELTRLLPKQPTAADDSALGLNPSLFGHAASGSQVAAEDLVVPGTSSIECRLPLDLLSGREFVVEGTLDPKSPAESAVQLRVGAEVLPQRLVAGAPIVTRPETPGRAQLAGGFEAFRQVFPAAMCYRRIVPVDEVITLVEFHREHEPLSRLMLDEAERTELDRLWSELRFISQDAFKIQEAYGQFMEYTTQDSTPELFKPLAKPINERAAELGRQMLEAEPAQRAKLHEFAERAYRRPLVDDERRELETLYDALRKQELPHEEAIRLVAARILVAPNFLYRVELPREGVKPGPVNDWELASRLSYFLWASMPDDELRQMAAAGKLRDPAVRRAQAQRMLRDDRARGLATEFALPWIDIHHFDSNDEKSEQHFPQFRELRGAMHEEAIRFFTDLFQRDGSVLSVLDADHTFLNGPLAAHYGIPGVEGAEWRRVDGVKRHARGGVLAMAAPLAMQSGASRTSPVLRGNWIVESLLGEKLPKPPKNVPLLPEDETATEGLTVRQLVEKHRSVAECNKCHQRIDPFGFALEGYDPIGRHRDKDLAGRPIETNVELADGRRFDGLAGVRDYLLNQRRDDFLRTFCKKLLGYSLGRGVALSDEPLLTEVQRALRDNDYRFSAAVDTILVSPQFLEHRGRDVVRPEETADDEEVVSPDES